MLYLLRRQILLAALTLVGTWACRERSPELTAQQTLGDCRLIAHDAGETEICQQPERVVALSMHMLDLLLALEQQPIGYAPIDPLTIERFDQPEQQIPYLGDYVTGQLVNAGSRSEPSLETLVRLRPDVILGETGFHQKAYSQLAQIAPTLLFGGALRDQWQRSLLPIAKALNRPEQADQVITAHRQRLAKTRVALAEVVRTLPRCLLLGIRDLKQPIQIRTGSDFAGGLLQDVGFTLVAPSIAVRAAGEMTVSLEAIPQLASDWVIVQAWSTDTSNSPLKTVRRQWQQSPVLQAMAASRAGRVYFVDYQLWSISRGPMAAGLVLQQLEVLLLS
ncbi:MAG: iron-siderophore ABC transporter substrate-binding protein [Leptolyngbya sp. SIOISBB]|nr:iron-siderophore ABC transporter substrate-binding protein [Leptolyngbya sp. SIOISBB]